MTLTNANRPTGDRAARPKSQIQEPASNSQKTFELQARVIRAKIDSNNFKYGNHIVGGHTPILTACRQLLALGLSPDAAVEIFRAGVLAVKIRSLRAGAALVVEECGDGRPRFRAYRPPPSDVLSPARKIPRGAP